VLVELMGVDTPRSIPYVRMCREPLGDQVYEWRISGEPVGPETMRWRTQWRVFRDGEQVRTVDDEYDWETFGVDRRAHERFTRAADDFADFFLNWSRGTTPVTVGSFLLLSAPMATVVTVLAGVGFALAGWTEPVSIVAFALLAPALCAPMNVIGSRVQQPQAAGAAAARVRALLDTPTLYQGKEPAPLESRVVFDGVSFSYSDHSDRAGDETSGEGPEP
jgi:ABC-type multidrug transport system fused ATPase/permease subunit